MDKETLLKICDAIYEKGFNVGQEDADCGLLHFLSDDQKEFIKKLRIKRVLKKFGVDIEGDKNV